MHVRSLAALSHNGAVLYQLIIIIIIIKFRSTCTELNQRPTGIQSIIIIIIIIINSVPLVLT
jgi:hypothetical protein